MSTDTWWTIRQALVEYRDKDFSSATNEQIHAMTDALAADLESQLAEQQQPAPVSATEPDAVRMLREGMRGQHALFNVNQEYVCAVAPLLEYIDALTARLAEAESEICELRPLAELGQHAAQELVDGESVERVVVKLQHKLAEAERVTEATRDTVREEFKQILCDDTSSYPRIIYPSNDVCDEIVRLRAALTAARRGG